LANRERALAGSWAHAGQGGSDPTPPPPHPPPGGGGGTGGGAADPARVAASWSRSMARDTAWRQVGLRPRFDLRLKVSCQVVRVGPLRRPGGGGPRGGGPGGGGGRAGGGGWGGAGAKAPRPFWSSSQAVCSSGTTWTATLSSSAGEAWWAGLRSRVRVRPGRAGPARRKGPLPAGWVR